MGYFDLTGRSAMVTGAGAGGGIGAAVAAGLAEAGAAVLVTDIDGDAAAAVAQRIRTDGGKADSCALDVGDRAAADIAAAQAARLGGGALHILVNNAGVTSPAMFAKLTDETFPEEVAGAFVFMASDAASYTTWQVLPVDGGMVM